MLESCLRYNSVVIACLLCSLGLYHTGIVHTETCSLFKSNMLEGVFLKCMARVTTTNFMVVENTESFKVWQLNLQTFQLILKYCACFLLSIQIFYVFFFKQPLLVSVPVPQQNQNMWDLK